MSYTREEWAVLTTEQRGLCVLAANQTDDHGYGRCCAKRYGKKINYTHVRAWIDHYGMLPPPETPCICHHCDNPACENIGHLYAGTHAQNMQDKVLRKRDHNAKKVCCPKCGGSYTDDGDGTRHCKPCKVLNDVARQVKRYAEDEEYREKRKAVERARYAAKKAL